MKGAEYAQKYKDGVQSNDKAIFLETMNKLYKDMLDEISDMIRIRNVKFDRGAIPIVREQNEKWNAMCRCWERDLGESPIKQDGLLVLLEGSMPGITAKVKNRR